MDRGVDMRLVELLSSASIHALWSSKNSCVFQRIKAISSANTDRVNRSFRVDLRCSEDDSLCRAS